GPCARAPRSAAGGGTGGSRPGAARSSGGRRGTRRAALGPRTRCWPSAPRRGASPRVPARATGEPGWSRVSSQMICLPWHLHGGSWRALPPRLALQPRSVAAPARAWALVGPLRPRRRVAVARAPGADLVDVREAVGDVDLGAAALH